MKAATKFARPTIVVSRCLSGARCRWDSVQLSNRLVDDLQQYARLILVCPEVEIGLGVGARERILLAQPSNSESLPTSSESPHTGSVALYQPATKRHLAQKMNRFSRKFLRELDAVDGFILKQKSPSCGLRAVKLYQSIDPQARFERRGTGLFAAAVREAFPLTPAEGEVRLEDADRREHWLTGVFTLAAFRETAKTGRGERLFKFHTHHRQMLAACNQKRTHLLDRLIADHTATASECALFEQYGEQLRLALRQKPTRRAMAALFDAALHHYSQWLTAGEKAGFRRKLRKYEAGTLPTSDLRQQIQIWAVRYDKSYVRENSFFRPYPGRIPPGQVTIK